MFNLRSVSKYPHTTSGSHFIASNLNGIKTSDNKKKTLDTHSQTETDRQTDLQSNPMLITMCHFLSGLACFQGRPHKQSTAWSTNLLQTDMDLSISYFLTSHDQLSSQGRHKPDIWPCSDYNLFPSLFCNGQFCVITVMKKGRLPRRKSPWLVFPKAFCKEFTYNNVLWI